MKTKPKSTEGGENEDGGFSVLESYEVDVYEREGRRYFICPVSGEEREAVQRGHSLTLYPLSEDNRTHRMDEELSSQPPLPQCG